MLTVKTIKADMAVGDQHAAHLINKSGRRVRHRYYDTAAYVYGVGAPHYPVPTLIGGAYVIDAALSKNSRLLVLWFGDGTTIAI